MNDKPAPRACSQCHEMLQPTLMGTSIDGNYNTKYHWSFGHTCPKQLQRYQNRLSEIQGSPTMSPEQKQNAVAAAGYMNAWAA
jgi:hypothetical protein